MRRLAGYPRGFYGSLILIFFALISTGLLLIPNMLMMRLDMDIEFGVSGGARLSSAAIHCTSAFLSMLIIGAISTVHIRAGVHRNQNIVTGFSLLTLCLVSLFSAVGLYYFGDEALSIGSSVVHTGSGLLILLLIFWHGISGHIIHNRRYGLSQK